MALNRVPEGRLLTKDCKHWLLFRRFYYYADMTGNEHVQMMQSIRNAVADAQKELEPHKIDIYDVYNAKQWDPQNFGEVQLVAIGFKDREDLVMAKMLLQCEEFYL